MALARPRNELQMSAPIGFVILSHNHPQQLLRLVRCLQRIYDNPPIAMHHDFAQSPLRREDFPSDLRFVLPPVNTQWGKLSTVMAVLRAVALLYESAAPDWFFLLSGADYPVTRAETVLAELASNTADALLDYRDVPTLSDGSLKIGRGLEISKYSIDLGTLKFAPPAEPENPALWHFGMPENVTLAWRRYLGFRLWAPVLRKGPRVGRYMLQLPLEDGRSPFTADFKCYYGDHWFGANNKAAEILLHPNSKHLHLRRYLRRRHNVDECYFQTVLANTSGLRISKATRRFTDWSANADGEHEGSHPKTLDLSDLPAIMSSKAYFARKFAPQSPVLDQIDIMLS